MHNLQKDQTKGYRYVRIEQNIRWQTGLVWKGRKQEN